ncbi:MAG: hypothetical protein K9N48_01205 [Verrucomicrobia bacterium]|nr:hypothetical protein [Verrucomicrobiota bacterium]MCF7707677.1 hypothetical protein [Verrucomicrobiota bacterium]
MKHLFFFMLVVAVVAVGCAKQSKTEGESPDTNAPPQTNETTNAEAGENPLTAPTDYLGAVAQGQKTSIRVVGLSSLKNAVRTFQAGEGRLPTNLNEIVQKDYMPKLPQAPSGMKFSYDPKTGEVTAESSEVTTESE